MRTSREEAARTRTRIVETAAALFKRDGIHATGLAGLMAEAGLTHGGFYGHFESKEHLVAEACALGFRQTVDRLVERVAAVPPARRLQAFVDIYLSEAHCDDPATGCGFAALGAELGRADPATRAVADEALRHYVGEIASFLPDFAPAAATRKARAIAATLLGAVTFARAVADQELARAMLSSARENVLAIASAGPRVSRLPRTRH
jgi:TetR/AcrR family transcriptional repressor of nem operon